MAPLPLPVFPDRVPGALHQGTIQKTELGSHSVTPCGLITVIPWMACLGLCWLGLHSIYRHTRSPQFPSRPKTVPSAGHVVWILAKDQSLSLFRFTCIGSQGTERHLYNNVRSSCYSVSHSVGTFIQEDCAGPKLWQDGFALVSALRLFCPKMNEQQQQKLPMITSV